MPCGRPRQGIQVGLVADATCAALAQCTHISMTLQVDAWSENICEGVLKRVSGLKKNYKYVVTCTLMQKCGAGIHVSRASVIDMEKDLVIKVDFDQIPTIQCMVAVYCLAI